MKRRFARVAVLALVASGLAAAVHAGDLADDLRARRERLMTRLGSDTMLVLWSAPVARYSLDVDYEYRQDSNLYYLSGITQEGTILVLMPGNVTRREVLFTLEPSVADEQWHGRRLTVDEARQRSGIDTVLTAGQFESMISALLGGTGMSPLDNTEAAAFLDARAHNRAHVALALESSRRLSDALTPPLEFARRARERFVGFDIVDATPALADLRIVKTPFERRMLERSVEIASEAQRAAMRAVRPGAYEYEVKAAVEAVHRARGAESWAYPSIVGSGPNATILHYPGSDRQMQENELLVVDAGCSYQYLASDITRTYPVTGTFSPAQKELYELVLRAQDEAAAVARAGTTLRDVHRKAVEVLKAGLLTLGLITDAGGDQYRMWYPHGTSHYLGIDVHDVGSLDRPLEPGMAFTIEPGLYIRQTALDRLPRTPENDALIAKVQPAVRRYADLGIRIEDSFLLDDTGLRRLSASVPRTLPDIEQFMRARVIPPGPAPK